MTDLSEMRRAVERYDGTYVSLSKPTVLALLDVVEAASDPAEIDALRAKVAAYESLKVTWNEMLAEARAEVAALREQVDCPTMALRFTGDAVEAWYKDLAGEWRQALNVREAPDELIAGVRKSDLHRPLERPS